LEKQPQTICPKKKTQFRILVWKNTHKEESQRKEKKSQEEAAAEEEENKKMCNKEAWQTSSIYKSDDGTAALAGTGLEGGWIYKRIASFGLVFVVSDGACQGASILWHSEIANGALVCPLQGLRRGYRQTTLFNHKGSVYSRWPP
jgi:hypothetical protein